VWGNRAQGSTGDEESPARHGRLIRLEESFSQQIEAEPEDGLGAAVVDLEGDRPLLGLPFTNRVGERKGYGQHGETFADPVGVDEVGVLEIEAACLEGCKEL